MQVSYDTPRLTLRPLSKDAAEQVLYFYKDNMSVFEPWEPKRAANFYTLAYQKASLFTEYNLMLQGKLLRYWVFLKDNPNEIVGTFCFHNFLKGPYQSCSLGYKFSKKFHHLGYAYESIHKGIDILLEDHLVHRIESFIIPYNYPSIRLIEKLNFIYEGISYSYANINGNWTDHSRYSFINQFVTRSDATSQKFLD